MGSRYLNQFRSFSLSASRSKFPKPFRKTHWSELANQTTHVDRALDHFDDLYGTVYSTNWPSLRLGLLSPHKYIAISNSFIPSDSISKKLQNFGAINLNSYWESGKNLPSTSLESIEPPKILEEIDEKMEAIGRTKYAEEMDVLYQNAPQKKQAVRTDEDSSRVLSDVKDASLEYITPSKLKGMEDFQLESEYYAIYNKDSNLNDKEYKYTTSSNYSKLQLPFLHSYTFEPGSASRFPSAQVDTTSGLREYICINGASICPVIAMALQPNLNVLDLCSGPGTKSLLALMTHLPSTLTCNDLETSRLSRVKKLFQEFIGTPEPSNVIFTKKNASSYTSELKFNVVLADVPCSSDRVSASISDNSLFKPNRTRERIGLATVQKKILLSAFSCLSPDESGSACIYSTCTLSPVENDGVVGAALRETEISSLHVDLKGLWEVLAPFKSTNLFSMRQTKFGVLIQPNIFSNFGPMYISRIVMSPQEHSSSSSR